VRAVEVVQGAGHGGADDVAVHRHALDEGVLLDPARRRGRVVGDDAGVGGAAAAEPGVVPGCDGAGGGADPEHGGAAQAQVGARGRGGGQVPEVGGLGRQERVGGDAGGALDGDLGGGVGGGGDLRCVG